MRVVYSSKRIVCCIHMRVRGLLENNAAPSRIFVNANLDMFSSRAAEAQY